MGFSYFSQLLFFLTLKSTGLSPALILTVVQSCRLLRVAHRSPGNASSISSHLEITRHLFCRLHLSGSHFTYTGQELCRPAARGKRFFPEDKFAATLDISLPQNMNTKKPHRALSRGRFLFANIGAHNQDLKFARPV